MDKRTLQWRVFGFLLAFCALLLLLLWLFQTVFLSDMYKWIRQQDMKQAIAQVEQNIDRPDLSALLSQLQQEKEILVEQSHAFAPPTRPPMNGRGKQPPEAMTETRDFIMADGKPVSLTFYAVITPVNATVSTLRVQLYCISVLLILLSILLAAVIARRISKPIVLLNQSAKCLAEGNYAVEFSGHGFLEIKELSDTLNTTAAELAKVEDLRRELMANISHDLRTPLALIYSYAELMHDFPSEITPEQTETILAETRRLSGLVDDVLDISRLESGVMVLHESEFSLTEYLRVELARLSELLRHEGYQLCFQADEEVCVRADEPKLNRVLHNLLVNAVNYGGESKEIIVTQELCAGTVRISVRDSGAGIPEDQLPYIWDRYYKVDGLHRRPVTGTGLGLSIVRKIITLHGGRYGVVSQLGVGSCFWFELDSLVP